MTGLMCPKCQSPMRSYERSGITVDQCTSCQGVFLDRGELERLVQAEDVHYSGGPRSGGQYEGGASQGRPGGFLGGLFGGEHGGRRGGHH